MASPTKEELEECIKAGLSSDEIRWWYGIKVPYVEEIICEKHNRRKQLYGISSLYWRCADCQSEYTETSRQKFAANRQRLIQEAQECLGGKCINCGYSGCRAALDFHHRDPDEKVVEVSRIVSAAANSQKKVQAFWDEVHKCDLLCRNCHTEEELAHRSIVNMKPISLKPLSDKEKHGICQIHGEVYLLEEYEGIKNVCQKCKHQDYLRNRYHATRKTLLELFNNECFVCGYKKTLSALHFHHINEGDKDFPVSGRAAYNDALSNLSEVIKCVLLCGVCHMEHHYDKPKDFSKVDEVLQIKDKARDLRFKLEEERNNYLAKRVYVANRVCPECNGLKSRYSQRCLNCATADYSPTTYVRGVTWNHVWEKVSNFDDVYQAVMKNGYVATAEKHNINPNTLKRYVRLYRNHYGIDEKLSVNHVWEKVDDFESVYQYAVEHGYAAAAEKIGMNRNTLTRYIGLYKKHYNIEICNRKRNEEAYICPECQGEKAYKAKICQACRTKDNRSDWLSDEEFVALWIQAGGVWLQFGKLLGLSDNGARKQRRLRGIELPNKSEIKQQKMV